MDLLTKQQLFKSVLYVRMVEEKIAELYPEQEMRCPVHLSIGQEATAVGVSNALKVEDKVYSNHRSHGHYLAKGGDLKKFFAELYGRSTGCAKGKGGSMHLIDLSVGFAGATPIVSNSMPIALGSAFSQWSQNNSNITVIYLGDGATEEGVFHECLNFAKLHQLPILFFCEDNQYSVYTPLSERQPSRPISRIPQAHGLDCYEVDGNDVIEVYKVTSKAVKRIREGQGPAFIYAPTYRWREHCGPYYDNHIGYRSQEEFEYWKKLDPLQKIQHQLLQESLISEVEIEQIKQKTALEIQEAVTFAKSSEYPKKEELSTEIYAK